MRIDDRVCAWPQSTLRRGIGNRHLSYNNPMDHLAGIRTSGETPASQSKWGRARFNVVCFFPVSGFVTFDCRL